MIDKRDPRRATGASALATGNIELEGKTLGIVGIGNIGRRVAKFAAALGMRVLGYDKYVPADEMRRRGAEPVREPRGAAAAGRRADLPHAAHPRDAAHDQREDLGLMKHGAIYINTSRGPVQDERALFEALTRGKLGAAGIDVFEEEPASADNPIFNLENVVVLARTSPG